MIPLLLLLLGCDAALVPPPAPAADPAPAWSALLAEVVTPDGYVDYAGLEARRGALDDYVGWLARHKPPTDFRPAFAHWLNAYNAWALWATLEGHRPPQAEASLVFRAGRSRVSLFDVRHERLRGRTLDERLHAAINPGLRSGPPVRAELYEAPQLERQLREQMDRLVNDPDRGVRITSGEVWVNPLFVTYARDFWFWSGGLDTCALLAMHAESTLEAELERASAAGCALRPMPTDATRNDPPG